MIGLVPLAATLVVIAAPDNLSLTTPGPPNTGHEDIACDDCHLAAAGQTRQQAQAALRWHLGLRREPAYLATRPVDNESCLGCHARANDRHPIYRFTEPRFAEARAQIGADQCVSCHREHTGVRVSAAPTICSSCHQDTALTDDPVDPPHVELIAGGRWTSCLGCHDFHGNHGFEPPARLEQAFSPGTIGEYLSGRAPLYSSPEAKPELAPRSRPTSANRTGETRHDP